MILSSESLFKKEQKHIHFLIGFQRFKTKEAQNIVVEACIWIVENSVGIKELPCVLRLCYACF
jgi:hypothetical protein